MAQIKRTQTANKARARTVFDRLKRAYPDARCALDFTTPLELLVATILAAQCTDVRVNKVTKTLFKKYRKPEDYLAAPRHVLEEDIRTCGFFRQKAKAIVAACTKITDEFGGDVPGTMDALLAINGVGRKTANVLLGECYDTPGIIVDTHCKRVTHRLGFTKNTDPNKIERDLMKIWPQEHLSGRPRTDAWTLFSHCIVFHGRAVCVARAPRCSQCPIVDRCPFPDTREGKKTAR